MRKLIFAAILAFAPSTTFAAGAGCQDTVGGLSLEKVRPGAVGSEIFGCINRTFDKISASSVSLVGSTSAVSLFGAIYVNEIGGRSAGTANIKISSPVYSSNSLVYMDWAGSATIRGANGLAVTYGLSAGSAAVSGSLTAGSATITGGSGASVAYGLSVGSVTITNHARVGSYLTVVGSATVAGAGGLGVTYGLSAGSATFAGGLTASSGSFIGGGGLGVTYGLSVGSASVAGGLTASSGSFIGGGGLGVTYGVTAGSGAFSGGVTASSGTFTATGATQYSIQTSSGIRINAGGLRWPDGTTSTTAVTQSSGGSGGGHVIASGTVSGSTVGVITGQLAQRTTLYFDTTGFDLYDDQASSATIVKSKGYQYLTSSATRVSDFSTSNTTLGVCYSTLTLTTGNNSLFLTFSGQFQGSTTLVAKVGFLLNGAFPTGVTSSFGPGLCRTTSSSDDLCYTSLLINNVPAGSNSVCLTAGVNAGTLNTASTQSLPRFTAMEVGTGGSGFAAPASSQTNGGFSSNFSNTSFSACASTLTITSSGGPTLVNFDAYAVNNTQFNSVSSNFLVDGAFVSPWTSAIGPGYEVASSAGNTEKYVGFSFLTAPMTGTHSYCLALRVGGGVGTLNTTNTLPTFRVQEARNAPGTGDVSSNGNNTMSGVNTFTGAVKISSGFSVNFSPSAYTTTQTSFLAAVTGSTGSFTVQGTTVTCRSTGGMQVGAAGQTLTQGIMVDGAFAAIPGTSKDVGINQCMAGASGGFGCSAPIDVEFQVTTGPHTFALGLWTNGSTLTWPGAMGGTSGTIGQFACREVPSR